MNCREEKALLKKSIKGYCFCMMRVNRRIMATYASKHKYARKSIFLVMTQMKRFVYIVLKHDLTALHSSLILAFWLQEGEPEPSGFADLMSSPKSPLSPDKSLQEKDNKSNCMLKTYLCTLLSMHYNFKFFMLSVQPVLTLLSMQLHVMIMGCSLLASH